MTAARQLTEEENPEAANATAPTYSLSVSYKIEYSALAFSRESLGEGTFSAIHKARWNGQTVAVKEISYYLASGKNQCTLNDCHREASIMQTLKALKAPNIVNILAYAEVDHARKFYIVMEYMPRNSLHRFISDKADHGISWGWKSRYSMMREITHSIAFLHANKILHRDIKSDNVLLDKEDHPKLSDFGLAKFIDAIVKFDGTPGWMAPELLMQAKPATEKSDVYALAVLFWEIAKADGSGPFYILNDVIKILLQTARGETEKIPHDCPSKVAKLITWGWQKKPEARPTAAQIEEELCTEIEVVSERLARIK